MYLCNPKMKQPVCYYFDHVSDRPASI